MYLSANTITTQVQPILSILKNEIQSIIIPDSALMSDQGPIVEIYDQSNEPGLETDIASEILASLQQAITNTQQSRRTRRMRAIPITEANPTLTPELQPRVANHAQSAIINESKFSDKFSDDWATFYRIDTEEWNNLDRFLRRWFLTNKLIIIDKQCADRVLLKIHKKWESHETRQLIRMFYSARDAHRSDRLLHSEIRPMPSITPIADHLPCDALD